MSSNKKTIAAGLSQKKQDENRDKYLNAAVKKRNKIKLVIIGQDPYPTSANGIPFCKTEIKELHNTSGEFILTKLGIDIRQFNDSGSILFHNLLEKGIVFLNLSYSWLKEDGEWLSKERINDLLLEGLNLNTKMIEGLSYKTIVLRLGSQKKLNAFFNENYRKPFEPKTQFQTVIHPSPFNRGREAWQVLWNNDRINDIEKFLLFLAKI